MRLIRASKIRIGDEIRFGDLRLTVAQIDRWNSVNVSERQHLPAVILFRSTEAEGKSLSLEPHDKCELLNRGQHHAN